jgi:hypothetical protein
MRRSQKVFDLVLFTVYARDIQANEPLLPKKYCATDDFLQQVDGVGLAKRYRKLTN